MASSKILDDMSKTIGINREEKGRETPKSLTGRKR